MVVQLGRLAINPAGQNVAKLLEGLLKLLGRDLRANVAHTERMRVERPPHLERRLELGRADGSRRPAAPLRVGNLAFAF